MSDGSIAIVGAACRFPGASDMEAFWQLLTAGEDAVTEVDARRWSTRFYFHPSQGEPGKSYTWSAGLITGVDLFEPAFFGISPREAAQMDPQQRLLLELVWHAIEDAGIPTARLSGTTTGVYIGASSTDYSDLRIGDPASGDSYFMTGNTLSILANRISYIFDLRGPSLTVDTACSSALVALHHACEAIRSRRISSAIVGGINLLLAPYPFLGFCRASMLSRRGRCFAFDERADGYVRGEGGGAVVLKPLADALADRDPIRAVILASGVNSDGRTIGLSLPSEAAQALLLRSVYADAGVAARDLAFFEMHGTGTPAGDPIEAAAVGQALGQSRDEKLPIGSVKTNIGHLEPASGMAGLLKAALALEHGVVPPTLHCETPNPNIPFDRLNLRLITRSEALPAGERCCAGVNSFGFGGTNAHVVLAAPPRRPDAATPGAAPLPPLAISARSEAALRALAQRWRDTLAGTPAERAPALLRAAARRRDHHLHRLVAFGRDPTETTSALAEFLDDPANSAAVAGTAVREGKLAFMFAGNGAQWPGMGRHAYHANAMFRAAIAEVDAVLLPALGWSVAGLLGGGVAAERLARADIAQPLLFAIQVGIVGVLRELGVAASGYCGHSVGEIAASWAAGALSLADAGRVVVARSRNQQRTSRTGRMAALALGGDAARDLLAELGSPLELAALNTTQSVTVSGPSAAIERLTEEARRRGVACRALDLDFAFHSAAMDPIRKDLLADLAGLASRTPPAMLVSTVTGDRIEGGMLDADYWWRNIRSPVRFAEATARLVGAGYRIFVEIGPHPVLQAYLRDGLRAAEGQGRALATLSRKQQGADPFPQIAAGCHVAGGDLTGSAWFDGPNDPRGLPLYPWQRERFWFEKTVEAIDTASLSFEHPLLGVRQSGLATAWLNHLDPEVLPWIADHAIEGMPVLPAAAILEMALAAARVRRPEARVLEIVDVELRRPLPFDKGAMREVRAVLADDDGDWELTSRPRLSSEPLTVHAVACIVSAGEPCPPGATADPRPIAREVNAETLYGIAGQLGLDYGSRFRTVTRIEIFGTDEAVAYLDPSAIGEPLDGYLLHPALLDGALQGLLALLVDRQSRLEGVSFLPWRFGRVRLSAPFARVPRRAELRLTRVGTRSASADIVLLDEAGAIVAEIAECWFRRVELTRRGSIDERVLRVDLVPCPLAEAGAPAVLDRVGAVLARFAASRKIDRARGEQALLLDALTAAVALQTVLGVAGPKAPFTIAGLVDCGRVAPDAAVILDCLLRLLERFGAAAATGPEWHIEAAHDLPEVAEIWRLLLADAPDLVGELALLAAAAADLPGILAGGARQSAACFSPMVEHLLEASPPSEAGIGLLCDALGKIAAKWPPGRKLRILEFGAGGTATRRMLDRLAQSGVALSYAATNPDPEQTARLGFLVASFTGATARQWSPRNHDDALDCGPFDIVLAVNAGARLQLDAMDLSNLREHLAPGGLFLAVEPEPNPLWDVVFGQNAGWWRGGLEDGNASPLRSGEGWRTELAVAGFLAPGTVPAASAPWPNAVCWGRAPSAAVHASPGAAEMPSITLITGNDMAARVLRERLIDVGYPVTAAAGEERQATVDGAREIILLVVDEAGAGDAAARSAREIAALARAAGEAVERHAALWVVTCGAQQAAMATEEAGVVGAALWGFARVLLNEMPRLTIRLLDLPEGAPWRLQADRIAAELATASPESEIVWTPSGRHVPRLRRGLPPRWAAASDLMGLASDPPGGLDSLGWKVRAPRIPGIGEVEIEVHAAGLNFRDMMWAMGLLPEEALIDGFAGPTFGLECAGVVRALGAGVEDLAIGDRVAGLAPASLATRVVTMARAVTRIPPDVGFAAAATVPVTFVTVAYALGSLAQLAAGEYVLIHAAAGGVGLAAIQYAKHRGAVVIATAGSEVKRSFLRLVGADHVLDSRDLAFPEAVRELTGGKGVDVVLNSLSGEAMEQSLAVLKPFGRFLELGKRDFYLNRRIHLRPLRQNISYFAIDVDQLPLSRPDLARSLLSEISAALAKGEIRPLAHRIFAFAEVDEAFRLMQSSGHIGKLVLVPGGNAGVRLREPAALAIRGDGTYLVTGGMTGFGFAAARWLAARGAGAIALFGRRGMETPGAAERVAELAALGAQVRVYRGDVADSAALAAALAAIRASEMPLRGVVHAAAAIADGLAAEVDAAHIAPLLRAKLGGAVALDRLTRDDPVELFLLFSSATTLLGAPGQGVYVAANAALEAVARRRRATGRPALAIAWGPIEDAGYLAERPEARAALARRLGAKPMPAVQALAGLPALIASGLATCAFAETSWNAARRYLPILATPLFSEIRADAASSPSDESLVELLSSLNPEEALALLKTAVTEEAANILRLPAGGIDPLRPLSEIGMDSLMAVELRLALESRLRIDLPLVSLAEGTSVTSIAGRLAGAVSARPQDGDLLGLVARYERVDDSNRLAAPGTETADTSAHEDANSAAAE